jgi:hypothetical protein
MSNKVIVFFLLSSFFVSAQKKDQVTVTGLHDTYTLCDNKIYEGDSINPAKFFASIRGNQIIKLASTDPRAVLFTVLDGKVYRSNRTTEENLLFYLKNDELFLRKGKDEFRSVGDISQKVDRYPMLMIFLQPMEYFALRMAARNGH